MRKKKKKTAGSDKEALIPQPESPVEYEKYLKKLDLQRSILTRIVNSDLSQIAGNTSVDLENSDSN